MTNNIMCLVLLTSGLCPSSGILLNTTFQKLDPFLSSDETMRGTYSVESVRKTNLKLKSQEQICTNCTSQCKGFSQ
jgi:hypothetical protein